MKCRLILATMFVLAVGTSAFGQVANGSFENGNCFSPFTYVPAGNSFISCWSVGGNSVDLICGLWQASDGTRSVDLSGGGAGSIAQTLTTEAGLNYEISFDFSGNPDGNPGNKTLSVSAGSTPSQVYTFNTIDMANSRTNMKWTPQTYNFSATANQTILTFMSLTPGFFGPALDNVQITVVSGTVCHRNKGKAPFKTMTFTDLDSFYDHLGHGDEPGPCPES